MNWISCSSSNLNAYAYDKENRTLYVSFKWGAIYAYYNVPENIFDGLQNASSKGQFHSTYIKFSFQYKRVK